MCAPRRAAAGRRRAWAPLLATAVLVGCTSPAVQGDGGREYLDEQTAATVTVGAPVMVFARERPELAVHARDYLTLVPVDVNRGGVHSQYFVGYAWSTIDKRPVGDETEAPARFELVADGRRIPLDNLEGRMHDIGLGEAPVPPPARSARLLIAPASREQQAFVAGAADVRAVRLSDGGNARYELWRR